MKLETIQQDLRYALRSLRREPAFTLAAVGALMIGIGANSAVFSVVDKVLLRPLSYPDPNRLVLFLVNTPQGPAYGGSAAKFNIWRQQSDLFHDVAAYEYAGSNLNVTGGTFPEQIHAIRVSASYFHLLGAPIIEGRAFTSQEDLPGGGTPVILSHALWQRRFGGDPKILGKTLSMGGEPFYIIGVTAATFNTQLNPSPDIFLPFQIDPSSADHATYFNVVARLRPGVTLPSANKRLQAASDEFRRRFPKILGSKDHFGVEPFHDAIVTQARRSLLILTGAVICVLLIACANVANLLLVRATARKREIAIRSALGASRGRIIRQLLTESILLSLIGGFLGLFIGVIGVRVLLQINPADIPLLGVVTLDGRLLFFAILVSLVTGILFGLLPALELSGRRSTRQGRTRSLLVAAETAIALVLLISAGLLMRSFLITRGIQRGINTHRVLTLRMSLAGSRFVTAKDLGPFIRHTDQQLNSLSGVEFAAVSYSLPLQGAFGIPFNIAGRSS